MSVIIGHKGQVDEEIRQNYTVKIGWSFGMEIIALYFAVVSLILYALICNAKQRPETNK